MLKAMRRNTKIFMWLLIIAFISWLGADVLLTGRGTAYAGIMFGKKVPLSEYKKAWEAVRTKAIFTYGDKFREVAKNLNLDREAWDRLILLYEAKRRKFRTDDSEVINLVKDIAIFKDKDGKFDRKTYEYILRHTFGLTPRDFEEQIREELTIKKMLDKQNEDVFVTDEEALKEYKTTNEKAKASYILFEAKRYYPMISCTEDELKEYFERNKGNFFIPEQVNVEYLGKKFSDEAEDAKNKIREEMQNISDEASEEGKLEGIAEKYSMEIKETGFFSLEDRIPGIGLAFNFARTALSLKPGEISGPIETKSGIYILRVKEKRQTRQAEFAEVKEEVEKALKKERAENEAKVKAEEALSAIKAGIARGDKFEDIVRQLSLQYKETEAFTRSSYIPGLGLVREFINAAFSLKEGEIFAEPVKVHNGFCILKLNAIIPIDENKYEEEKEKFKERLLTQKRYINFLTWFNDLRKRANLRSNL